jgi:threonine dehydrogenase-like Zn-dependent dehydrogenase
MEKRVQGIVFLGDRKFDLMSCPDPSPGPDDAVLEMRASGMCGSDLDAYRRPPGETSTSGMPVPTGPVIAGHEPCGVVVAVGRGVDPRQARVGERMMVHHYSGCRACEHCVTGWPQLCQRERISAYGSSEHGGHAPYLKVPAHTLVRLPEALSFRAGAAISCGTGTAYGALERLKVSGRDTIVIFGQGPVGLSATQLATAMGARVIALDTNEDRLARATQFGAQEVINPSTTDAIDRVKELTHGRGAEFSLDTSASPLARATAVRCTRTWGTACFVGSGGQVTLNVSPDMLRKQMTVLGHWTFSTVGQAECASFVVDHGIDVDAIFTNDWALGDGEEAYRLFDAGKTGKGVFLM